ncbi:Alpha/Beta hydrolase protein [Mycena epipterygia]|nr:Alpha/Beta hydrolase protein [Mycena epipterygia]
MPTITVKNDVEFSYTDSGALPSGDYTTVVIIHGHTFHNQSLQRLNPFAQPNNLRIIAVNRREYPGSSAYSAQELTTFNEGTETERASLLAQQGYDLALFVDGLIQELSLPTTGGIALVGWSLGTVFLLSLVASIGTLPTASKDRLAGFVRTVVMLQPPSLALGLPDPPGKFTPHTDPDIASDARGPAFAKWVSSYFIHGDLSTRNVEQLTYDNKDPLKQATVETIEPSVLFSIAGFAPAEKCDNTLVLPPFEGLVAKQTNKALFDPAVRSAWSNTKFWHLYGNAEPWNVIYAAWFLEGKSTPELPINVKLIEGCNHFVVWEDPEKVINELKECFRIA